MSHNDRVDILARDLTKEYPRSPRETLGGFVLASRTLDKCRAVIVGSEGEYHYDCPLDREFFDFTKIDSTAFRKHVESGATDTEMDLWIRKHSKVTETVDVVNWNNKLRCIRLMDLPMHVQLYLEDYIPKFIPRNRPVYVWFDVYDLEEERI